VDPVTPFGIKKVDLVFPAEQIVLRERRVAFEDAVFRPEIGRTKKSLSPTMGVRYSRPFSVRLIWWFFSSIA